MSRVLPGGLSSCVQQKGLAAPRLCRLVRDVIERVEVDEPSSDVRVFIADLGSATETIASAAGAKP